MAIQTPYWTNVKDFLRGKTKCPTPLPPECSTPYHCALIELSRNRSKRSRICQKVRSQKFDPINFARLIRASIEHERTIPGPADSLLDELCRSDKIPQADFQRARGDSFYMPTQVREIELAIAGGYISSNDYFIDIGCGPGARMPVYVHLRTGAYALGFEKYEQYYQHAQTVVSELKLKNVRVQKADALHFDYSAGNVFLLASPVEGRKLIAVAKKILHDTHPHPVTILSSGKATQTLSTDPRLSLVEVLSPSGLSVYRSDGH